MSSEGFVGQQSLPFSEHPYTYDQLKTPELKKKKIESHWMGKYDLDFLSPLLPGVSANQKNSEYEAIANGKNHQTDHQRTGLSQPIG